MSNNALNSLHPKNDLVQMSAVPGGRDPHRVLRGRVGMAEPEEPAGRVRCALAYCLPSGDRRLHAPRTSRGRET